MSKVAITYICTGKYKRFFPAFYESFRENFCPNDERTFVIITDDVEWVKAQSQGDILAYDTQRRFKKDEDNADYCKFRKWKDILLAEDFLETQDYAFYFNGNSICMRHTTLDDILGGMEDLCLHRNNSPKASELSDIRSAAWYDPTGTKYVMPGLAGGTSKRFLQCARFIEACRNYDAVFGYDRRDMVPWHDETYYNRYFSIVMKTRQVMEHTLMKGVFAGGLVCAFCSEADATTVWHSDNDKSNNAHIAIYDK